MVVVLLINPINLFTMSLHTMVCNKPRPCYKCTESINLPSGDKFHIGWEYQIDYVEKRLSLLPNAKMVLETNFKKLT
jgi:hypothetical protein